MVTVIARRIILVSIESYGDYVTNMLMILDDTA